MNEIFCILLSTFKFAQSTAVRPCLSPNGSKNAKYRIPKLAIRAGLRKELMQRLMLLAYSALDDHLDTPEQSERRKHPRVPVHGPGYLFRSPDDEIVRVFILNICIAGFSCRSRKNFIPGERANCIIAVGGSGCPQAGLYLLLRAVVMRVEETSDPDQPYQVACQIQEYRVFYLGGAMQGPESESSIQ